MSLKSWKAEFYPVPAHKVAPADAVAHSLRKWRGALPDNLAKHGLRSEGWRVFNSREGFEFACGTCSLCRAHATKAHRLAETECAGCPLYLSRGSVKCDDVVKGEYISPWHAMSKRDDPLPMVRALEKAAEWELEQKAKAHEVAERAEQDAVESAVAAGTR